MLRTCANPNCSVQFDHRLSKCPGCGDPAVELSTPAATSGNRPRAVRGLEPGSPICPNCGREMERGRLLGDRYPLRWLPADKSLLLGVWAVDGENVGEGGYFRRPQAQGHTCRACGKIIIPG